MTKHLQSSSRRRFLKTSTAAMVSGAIGANLPIARSAYVAGSDLLRIGLIGCGGRGTGAAQQALAADKNVKLVAMGDAFADRLESSLAQLMKKEENTSKIGVSPALTTTRE
jgi:predicted homoserine dehydrogenase-like protein